MSTIEQIIEEKLAILQDIYTDLKETHDQIKAAYSNALALDESIKDFVKIKENTVFNVDTISNCMASNSVIAVLSDIIYHMYKVLDMFNVEEIELMNQVSKTYVLNTEMTLHQLKKKFAVFTAKDSLLTESLLEETKRKILAIDMPVDKKIEEVHEGFIKHINAIELYVIIMKHFIKLDKIFMVLDLLEKSKNHVLEQMGCIPPHSTSSVKNCPFMRFGLNVVTTSMTLASVMQLVLGKTDVSVKSIRAAGTLCKQLNICIIVVNQIVKNPVEYAIWHLLETSAPTTGLNVDLIKYYETIRAAGHASKSWDFSIDTYGAKVEKAQKFAVLSTLDGATYRVLTPWRNKWEYCVVAHQIKPLIDFIAGYAFTRVDNYTAAMIRKAQETAFLENQPKFYDMTSQFEAKYLRHVLVNELRALYRNTLRENQQSVSAEQFSDLIHNDVFPDKFREIVLQYYKQTTGDTSSVEMQLTFTAFLHELVIEFRKELHQQFKIHKIEESQNADKSAELASDILNGALQTVITDESNIYQAAFMKKQMLAMY